MPNPVTAKKSRLAAIQSKSEAKTSPLPPLPKSLPKEYRNEWRALVQHLRDNEIWVPQKSGLVEAYLMNLKAVREAEASLQQVRRYHGRR